MLSIWCVCLLVCLVKVKRDTRKMRSRSWCCVAVGCCWLDGRGERSDGAAPPEACEPLARRNAAPEFRPVGARSRSRAAHSDSSQRKWQISSELIYASRPRNLALGRGLMMGLARDSSDDDHHQISRASTRAHELKYSCLHSLNGDALCRVHKRGRIRGRPFEARSSAAGLHNGATKQRTNKPPDRPTKQTNQNGRPVAEV